MLDIPFKVSENTRFVKNLLYGYHGNCLTDNMVLIANNCQNEHENRYFSNAPRNHKLQGVTTKLCDDSSILVLFKKVILKWVGVPEFWERQVEK